MMNTHFLGTFFLLFTDVITNLSDTIFQFCNRLVGHSQILDTALALPMTNQFIKAALLGGCLLAAWFGQTDEAAIVRTRKILMITLIASVGVIATTKTLSKIVFLPRPFIQSQKAFYLENETLIEAQRLPFRVPLDAQNQKDFQALLSGEILPNDLGSFPSDHAGFYMTLAVGIWLAARRIGLLAIAWTAFAILGSRVISGQHSPLDVVCGAGIGVTILLTMQFILRRWGQRLLDPLAQWTLAHPALSSALLFAIVFEAANTLSNVRDLLKTGVMIGKQLIGV